MANSREIMETTCKYQKHYLALLKKMMDAADELSGKFIVIAGS